MGKSVYFYNCIRAIRQTVYGRDNRKPIADALSALEADIAARRADEVEQMKIDMQRKIDEFDAAYSSFNGGGTTLISGDSYSLNL